MKKKCSKCKEIKEESEFYFDKIHNCYFAECKICIRKRNLKFAKKNNYKCQRRWQKNNVKKFYECIENWKKKNPKKIFEYNKVNKDNQKKRRKENPKLYKLIKQFDYLKRKFKKLTGIKMTFERQRLSIELLTQRIEKIKGLIKYYQEVYFLNKDKYNGR